MAQWLYASRHRDHRQLPRLRVQHPLQQAFRGTWQQKTRHEPIHLPAQALRLGGPPGFVDGRIAQLGEIDWAQVNAKRQALKKKCLQMLEEGLRK